MKKIFLTTFILLSLTLAVVAHAQQGQNLKYTPLEPIPGVTTGTNGAAIDFPTLLGNIYKIAITIGALFSVLMLTVSGIRYMLSDVVTDKERAKKRITACLYGLVLIAVSWLILNTINPQLVTFNLNPGSGTVTGSTGTNNNSAGGGGPTPQGFTVGTATGDQMRQVGETLGLKNSLGSDQYLLFDSSKLGAGSDTQKAYDGYVDFCEKSGFYYNASGGLLHYSVKTAPGSIFNSPGQTALVCSDN